MEYKYIEFKHEDGISYVTINRPKALNALNVDLLNELEDVVAGLEKCTDTKVVILTGGGEKSFVAGADIGELNQDTVITGHNRALRGQAIFARFENLNKPVIAAVNGFALGGGCELALACDIRLASEKAKLGQPEVNLGIIPGYGGTQRLARLVGYGMAKMLIFTGDIIKADEAFRIGLVDAVYAPEELMNEAIKLGKKIASKGPLAIAAAKKAINQGMDTDLASGLRYEASLFGYICGTEDKLEGTGAFLEKREAKFEGK